MNGDGQDRYGEGGEMASGPAITAQSSPLEPRPSSLAPRASPLEPRPYRTELERVEIQILLEGIYRYYGFDFRSYAYASLKRRLWHRAEAEHLTTISALQ